MARVTALTSALWPAASAQWPTATRSVFRWPKQLKDGALTMPVETALTADILSGRPP